MNNILETCLRTKMTKTIFSKEKKKANKTLGMKMKYHVNLKGENCVLTKKKKNDDK